MYTCQVESQLNWEFVCWDSGVVGWLWKQKAKRVSKSLELNGAFLHDSLLRPAHMILGSLIITRGQCRNLSEWRVPAGSWLYHKRSQSWTFTCTETFFLGLLNHIEYWKTTWQFWFATQTLHFSYNPPGTYTYVHTHMAIRAVSHAHCKLILNLGVGNTNDEETVPSTYSKATILETDDRYQIYYLCPDGLRNWASLSTHFYV